MLASPSSAPMTADHGRPRTIVDILASHAEAHPHRIAYRFLETGDEETASLTFAALFDAARRIGSALAEREPRGERLLLCLDAGLGFVEAFFGCLCSGAAPVPVDLPRANRPSERVTGIAAHCR